MGKQRLAYFDVAKALAMAAVITGHLLMRYYGTPDEVNVGFELALDFCFSFHVPLFFIVSGYFIHADRPFDWLKESRSLGLPYLATCVVLVAGISCAYLVSFGPASALEAFAAMLSASAFGAGGLVGNPLWPQVFFVGAIWYLLALFWARFVAICCIKAGRWAPVLVCACFAVAVWSARIVYLPLSFQAGLAAVPFVAFGFWLRRVNGLEILCQRPWALLVFASVWGWAIAFQGTFGMATVEYGDTPLDIVRNLMGGVSGSLVILCLLRMFEERIKPSGAFWRLLGAMGANTLAILCVHIVEEDGVPWATLFDFLWGNAPVVLFWPVLALVVIAVDVAFAVRDVWRRLPWGQTKSLGA